MGKVTLIILDGFGFSPDEKGNAILAARTPFLDTLASKARMSALKAAGEDVGLPWGESGNSEVGHINLGAGRVVISDYARIDETITNGSFFENKVLQAAASNTETNKTNFHIIGILTNQGVHGHIDHLMATIKYAQKKNINPIVHLITDGRDSSPRAAIDFVKLIEEALSGDGLIGSVSGRYYAMDRDSRWDRTASVYEMLVSGRGEEAVSATQAIEDSYLKGISDEFIVPVKIKGSPAIKNKDSIIFTNFRADRAIQLTEYFTDPSFNVYQRNFLDDLFFATMTQYRHKLNATPLFTVIDLNNPRSNSLSNSLAQVISENNLSQLHMAESEKEPHVTYFFNAGKEVPFAKEFVKIIPSPKVATYDLKPEMSLPELAEELIKNTDELNPDFSVVNFANADMVGHTGNMEATIKAIETIDKALGRVVPHLLKKDYSIFITGDHGNAESLVNIKNDSIDKEHSINPVPLYYVTPDALGSLKDCKAASLEEKQAYFACEPVGLLADVAPTILSVMGIDKPSEMTGESILGVLK